MPTPKPLSLEKLIRIPNLHGYDVAPDDKTAAVVWDKSGQPEIYLIPITGKGRPKQITSGPESKVAPRFSPDGRRLVFAQDYGGDENFDLFLYDLRTRQTRNLTPDSPETINPDVSWSPDGARLAFTSSREGSFATFILEIESGAVRRMTHHTYTDYGAEWSPDGRNLAVVAHTRGQTHHIFIVDVASGAARALAGPHGPVDAIYPRWSPDGRRIAFSSFEPGMYSIFIYELETGALQQITPSTSEAFNLDWSPDERHLVYTLNADGNEHLWITDLHTSKVRFVGHLDGVHSQPRFSQDGRKVFFIYNGPRHPPDLWSVSLSSGRKRRITRSLPEGYRPSDFISPLVARWESEGLTISGLLYLPKGFRPSAATKPPAVLYVHGGPTWQYKNEWYVTAQALACAGYVVLCPNYRGSTGYGRAFQEANRFDLGGADMRDVIAGAQWLVAHGYADAKRLAITGSSYGGYLTMTALTKYPQVFAAGSALVPYLNWFTEHENEREDLQYWDLENFGDPVKDAERYREYSPIYFMENIVAPVQMIAGANDTRCPASETEQAAAVLKDLEVPHEVIIYADEGHGFRKMENRVDAYVKRVKFLKTYLKSKPSPKTG